MHLAAYTRILEEEENGEEERKKKGRKEKEEEEERNEGKMKSMTSEPLPPLSVTLLFCTPRVRRK